jgi:hypothetical protein
MQGRATDTQYFGSHPHPSAKDVPDPDPLFENPLFRIRLKCLKQNFELQILSPKSVPVMVNLKEDVFISKLRKLIQLHCCGFQMFIFDPESGFFPARIRDPTTKT